LNIIYCSSESYIIVAATSIVSLFENNKDSENLTVYILSSDITENSISQLNELSEKYDREIIIKNVSTKLEQIATQFGLASFRGGFEVYSTLFLAEILPELDKALMIDADTIVMESLVDLWNHDLKNGVLAAVPEVALYSKISSSEDMDILYRNKAYFNTGVLLYDLVKWRDRNVLSLIEEGIKNRETGFRIFDQSILNYVLGNEIAQLPCKYNFYTAFHSINYTRLLKSFPKKNVISESEFYDATSNPSIIHFVGNYFERPWYENGYSPFKSIYLDYVNRLNWDPSIISIGESKGSRVIKYYDFTCLVLRKMGLYSFYHWYRYVFGQYIKKLTGVSR